MYASLRIISDLSSLARQATNWKSPEEYMLPNEAVRRVWGVSAVGPYWHLWVMRMGGREEDVGREMEEFGSGKETYQSEGRTKGTEKRKGQGQWKGKKNEGGKETKHVPAKFVEFHSSHPS